MFLKAEDAKPGQTYIILRTPFQGGPLEGKCLGKNDTTGRIIFVITVNGATQPMLLYPTDTVKTKERKPL